MAASSPNPALVTIRAARRLPRWALLMLAAAYLLPGVFGRDPWRNADLIAFGHMAAVAEGRSGWLLPTLGWVLNQLAFPVVPLVILLFGATAWKRAGGHAKTA